MVLVRVGGSALHLLICFFAPRGGGHDNASSTISLKTTTWGGTSGAKSFGLNSGGTTSPPTKSEPVVEVPVTPRPTRLANYVGSQGKAALGTP